MKNLKDQVGEISEEVQSETARSEASEQSDARTVRPRYRMVAAAVLPLAIAVGAVIWYHNGKAMEKPPATATTGTEAADSNSSLPPGVAAASEIQMRQISVEPVVERTAALERETTGKVSFNEDRITPVFPNCGGRVLDVLVKKGDVVKAGQPLLILESPDIVSAENDLAAARSAENVAVTAEDVASKTLDRAKGLHEREAISTKDLQEAEASEARAKDEVLRARAAVRVAEARLALYGKTAEEITKLGNLGKENAGEVDNRVVIRAPLSGTIVDRKVGPGQYIRQEASDPLVLISDLSSLWVLAEVYESFLSKIHVGAPVTISVAANPDRTFPAHVSFINPTVDPTTRTVHVRCEVPNPSGLLKPEMFAKISIGAEAPRPFPAVPASAIFTQGDEAFAFVEESPRQFQKRSVKIGQRVDDQIFIESGLHTGERIATHGVLLLNGMVR